MLFSNLDAIGLYCPGLQRGRAFGSPMPQELPKPQWGEYAYHHSHAMGPYQFNLSPISHFSSKPIFNNVKRIYWSFPHNGSSIYDLARSLIQSRVVLGEIYYWIITFVHNLVEDTRHHPVFIAKSFEKRKIFFNPHPPIAFKTKILSYRAHGIIYFSLFPHHK